MGLTTILHGFKVAMSILSRFLDTDGAEPTWGYPPFTSAAIWVV